MTWVAWRQQRTEMAIAAAILVVVAALLVPSGLQSLTPEQRSRVTGELRRYADEFRSLAQARR